MCVIITPPSSSVAVPGPRYPCGGVKPQVTPQLRAARSAARGLQCKRTVHRGLEVSHQTGQHPPVTMVCDVRSDELELYLQSRAKQNEHHMTKEGWMELLDITVPKLKVTRSFY